MLDNTIKTYSFLSKGFDKCDDILIFHWKISYSIFKNSLLGNFEFYVHANFNDVN